MVTPELAEEVERLRNTPAYCDASWLVLCRRMYRGFRGVG